MKLDIAKIRERAENHLNKGLPFSDPLLVREALRVADESILSLCDALEEAVKGMCDTEDNCGECNEKLARISAKLKGEK